MKWIVAGAILAGLGVAIGAFGAHGLPGWLTRAGRSAEDVTRAMAIFETAVRYQMYHALALLAVGFCTHTFPGSAWNVAGALFIAGVAIFSGMLYALVLTDVKWLGAIVPIGGLALIAGWLVFVWAAWQRK